MELVNAMFIWRLWSLRSRGTRSERKGPFRWPFLFVLFFFGAKSNGGLFATNITESLLGRRISAPASRCLGPLAPRLCFAAAPVGDDSEFQVSSFLFRPRLQTGRLSGKKYQDTTQSGMTPSSANPFVRLAIGLRNTTPGSSPENVFYFSARNT